MGFPLNGLVIAILAVLIVVARVLWPKEALQRRREGKRFASSVSAMRQGLDMLADERYDQALILFGTAAKQTPNKPAPVLLQAYALGLQGRRREALREVRWSVQRWPVETLPKRLLALAYLGAGQFDRAYANAQLAASEEPTMAAALRTLGDVCRIIERYPEAERMYRAAVSLGEPHPYAGLAWVVACQGRWQEAETELSQAPERTLTLFETQLALAQIHFHAHRLEDAVAVYQSLLGQHANVPRVLVPYGLALQEMGRASEARSVLSRSVSVSPEDPFSHCALASVLVEHNDLAAASVHAREALRLWPGYGAARGVYGDVLKRAGRYEAAEEQYREALRLNPFLAQVHMRLAALLRVYGVTEEAAEHEREALRLRPATPQPITQEVVAVTTQTLAAGVALVTGPRTEPIPEQPADVYLELIPTTKRRDPPKPETPPLPVAPRTPPLGDIPVFPGASLLFDESRETVLTQALQTDQSPLDVLSFYRTHMHADNWQADGEQSSVLAHIDGMTLRFRKGAMMALITVGSRSRAAGATPDDARWTYVVTSVTLGSGADPMVTA
jgi:tetratricopeptide (TPR) repeat protein